MRPYFLRQSSIRLNSSSASSHFVGASNVLNSEALNLKLWSLRPWGPTSNYVYVYCHVTAEVSESQTKCNWSSLSDMDRMRMAQSITIAATRQSLPFISRHCLVYKQSFDCEWVPLSSNVTIMIFMLTKHLCQWVETKTDQKTWKVACSIAPPLSYLSAQQRNGTV